jgi:hypothetical protein
VNVDAYTEYLISCKEKIIITIIAKNILTVKKSVPKMGCYRAYPLTVPGLCLHCGSDSWPKLGPGTLLVGSGRARGESRPCRVTDPLLWAGLFGHV